MLKKLAFAAVVATSVFAAQVQAAQVTWGVSGLFNNGTAINGTVSFDDTPVQGLYDGSPDFNDTHVYDALFTLSSAALGWSNVVFSNFTMQPYNNSTYGDGPHVDSAFYTGNAYLTLSDFGSAYLYDGNFNFLSQGSWSLDRNYTPIPATLPLMGLGLAALAFSRKKKAA